MGKGFGVEVAVGVWASVVVGVGVVGRGVKVAAGIDVRMGVGGARRADEGTGVDAGPTGAVTPLPHATRGSATIEIINGQLWANLTAASVLSIPQGSALSCNKSSARFFRGWPAFGLC